MGKRKDALYYVVVSGYQKEGLPGIPMAVVSERVREPKHIRQSLDRNTALYGRYMRHYPGWAEEWREEDAVNRRASDVLGKFDTKAALLDYLKRALANREDMGHELPQLTKERDAAQLVLTAANNRVSEMHNRVHDANLDLLVELGGEPNRIGEHHWRSAEARRRHREQKA